MTRRPISQPAPEANDPHLELLRAVRVCHPGWDLVRAISFGPAGDNDAAWTGWLDTVFLPVIRPELMRLTSMAGNGNILFEADAALDSALPESQRAASKASGNDLLQQYAVPHAEKSWTRYARAVAGGETAGHLAVVLAMRSVAFHLPPSSTIASYLFLEAKGGFPKGGVGTWMKKVEDGMARPSAQTFVLRAA